MTDPLYVFRSLQLCRELVRTVALQVPATQGSHIKDAATIDGLAS
jgi:hypothetical protein